MRQEPLFLERKDFASLAWWIELVKMSGFKRVVLYNNSIPNDESFNNLFRKNKNFIEIHELKCLRNFFNPRYDKYLSHYNEFVSGSGEWNMDNYHFLGFDAIANNECLYSHSNDANLVLIQDNDEVLLAPRLQKFNTLSKTIAFLSQKENSFSTNKQAFPTRGDCNMNAGYLSSHFHNEVYSRQGVDQDHSFFFQNIVYVNDELIEIIFEQINAIDISKSGFPIKLKIKQDLKPDKQYPNEIFGAKFVFVINNLDELNYARNMLDVHTNLIKPYLRKAISSVPEEYKRFYFFTKPLVSYRHGKSLTNLDSSTFSDPHRPNGKVYELEDYYMSHFRRIAVLEKIEVSIKSFIVDFNYFFCYFQPMLEDF